MSEREVREPVGRGVVAPEARGEVKVGPSEYLGDFDLAQARAEDPQAPHEAGDAIKESVVDEEV